MKVWPIDPLVPRNLRLEVPEKLPQGLHRQLSLTHQSAAAATGDASGSGDAHRAWATRWRSAGGFPPVDASTLGKMRALHSGAEGTSYSRPRGQRGLHGPWV